MRRRRRRRTRRRRCGIGSRSESSAFPSSPAVAATDGTVRKRFTADDVADRALLKTGSLEGVRALAGYVLGPGDRRYVVVCFVNHRNAGRTQRALDLLVEQVYAGMRDGARR